MKRIAWLDYSVLLLLVLLAGLGGLYPLQLFSGVEYLTGGIWALVAMTLFGPAWGISAAAAASLPTLLYWGHPYGAVLLTVEVASVSILMRKWRLSIVPAMLLHWIGIGFPLVWIFYCFIMESPHSSTLFVMFKMGINGLGNAALAALVIHGCMLLHKRCKLAGSFNRSGSAALESVPMSDHLAQIMIAIVLTLAIIQLSLHSRRMIADEQASAVERLESAAQQYQLYMSSQTADQNRQETLRRLAASMPDLRFHLLESSPPADPGISQAGSRWPASVLAYWTGGGEEAGIQQVNESVSLWKPPLSTGSRINQRMESVFLMGLEPYGSGEKRVVAELPAGPIWREIYNVLAKDLAVAFSLLALAVLLIHPISRRLTRPLAELSALSGKVPSTIGGPLTIRWPDSSIAEIQALSAAFAGMSRELNRQFTAIFEATQEAMLLCAKDGTILYANSRLGSFFGAAAAQAPNASELFALLAQPSAPGAPATEPLGEQFQDFLRQGRHGMAFQRYFPYQQGNGKQHYVVYATVIAKDGADAGGGSCLLIFRDRTEEELREEEKDWLLCQISHEFRTPLTSILGFSEMMRSKELSPARQQSYIHTIYNEAVRLSRLVDDFLDLQRMEAGSQTYNPVPLDAAQVAAYEAEQWRLEQPGRLELHLPEEPAVILADADRLRQAMSNLLGNAFKYSPQGTKVRFSVTVAGERVRIQVSDQGLGIPETDLNKIFRKFYKVEHADRRKIPGSGLGLSIVKEIVEAHHGEISVSSRHGEGSVFTLDLPLYEPPATAGRILLIERNNEQAAAVTSAMEQQGHRVLRLGSFEEALYAINSRPDQMPRVIAAELTGSGLMNGLEFAVHLLEQGADLEYRMEPPPLLFLDALTLGGSAPGRTSLQADPAWSIRQITRLSAGHTGVSAYPGLHCYFPPQDEASLTAQLGKFGLYPSVLQPEYAGGTGGQGKKQAEVLAAVFQLPASFDI